MSCCKKHEDVQPPQLMLDSDRPAPPLNIENPAHPSEPRSNVIKIGRYDPDKYTICPVSPTIVINEALIPYKQPSLAQRSLGLYLRPTTLDLDELPPAPTVAEFADAVIERMVDKDKAFWVDKPGANAYEMFDATVRFKMVSEPVFPARQSVFPRSYQYELECVKYRARHACDGMSEGQKKEYNAVCRDCRNLKVPALTPFQLAWAKDPGQKRWRYYPDLTEKLSNDEIRKQMVNVGRPFRSEACNWYYEHYPSVKYKTILRKFAG